MASTTAKKTDAQDKQSTPAPPEPQRTQDPRRLAASIRDSGATNRERLARDTAQHLDFSGDYSEEQFIADAQGRELSPQEHWQAEQEMQDHPGEPSTEEAEYLGESAREGRGHPGSGVA